MPTGVVGTQARQYQTQQLHYFRKTVNYDDADVGTGVEVGMIPAGAHIVSAWARISTGFNSAGTNRLVVGTNTNRNNVMTSTVAAASTTGAKVSTIGGALSFTKDTPLYVKYTAATGTAASAGVATITVAFAPDNDR